MRTLIVVESHWGNTGDIAHAIAEGLTGSGRVDVVNVDDAPTELAGVQVAPFDTRVASLTALPGSAAAAAARVVRSAGIPLTQRPTSFYVEGMTGPLVAGELDRARAWGRAFMVEPLLVPSA